MGGDSSRSSNTSGLTTLLAGALAGISTDVILFPLDTIKTRLQAPGGLVKSGGFTGIWSGIGPVSLTSAPSAALFFGTYEGICNAFGSKNTGDASPLVHMVAASVGEVNSCIVRVPSEVVKQRMQAGHYTSFTQAIRSIFRHAGLVGFYQGFSITLFREVPFACIQFPLYEASKSAWSAHKAKGNSPYPISLASWEIVLCGSISGGVAAALTTPCDVIKTRIMLHETGSLGIAKAVRDVWVHEGASTFFRGLVPRVTWIAAGGGIFFGVYEYARWWLR